MTANNPLIEVCVEGIDGLLAAQAAGADGFAPAWSRAASRRASAGYVRRCSWRRFPST